MSNVWLWIKDKFVLKKTKTLPIGGLSILKSSNTACAIYLNLNAIRECGWWSLLRSFKRRRRKSISSENCSFYIQNKITYELKKIKVQFYSK